MSQLFQQVPTRAITIAHDPELLQQQVCEIREKIRSSDSQKRVAERFDLKNERDVLIDIEFIVQYLVLRLAKHHPHWLRYTDNITANRC